MSSAGMRACAPASLIVPIHPGRRFCPPMVPVALELLDVSGDDLSAALRRAAHYCFDLAAEIPLRAWLFRVDAAQHVLLLLVHHIAADGSSMRPLVRDLCHAYGARQQGHAPSWTVLPVQYADYTLWQRRLLGAESDPDSPIAQPAAFWSAQLAGPPRAVAVPHRPAASARASYRGANVPFRLEAELHHRLLRLAREQQATLFMVLQAALAVLLSRLGAGTDIPLGTPIAGRTDEALEESGRLLRQHPGAAHRPLW